MDELTDHAAKLLKRMNELNMSPGTLTDLYMTNDLARAKYVVPDFSFTTQKSLVQNINAEMAAIDHYREVIRITEDVDPVTNQLLKDILKDEEEHKTELEDFFKDIGISVVVKGGQTMNPSSEDFVSAIKKANAHNVFIFPNNSNIVMAASQASEMVEDADTNVYVIPSKTIPQGISSAIMFNPEADPEENFRCMKAALKNVKSGEVTFAIRDTEIGGVKVKKNDFIGIFEKDIVVDNPDKIATLMTLLEKMVDDESSIITILVGEDVNEEEMNKITEMIGEKFSDLDLDIRQGNQPVYSFLIGIE